MKKMRYTVAVVLLMAGSSLAGNIFWANNADPDNNWTNTVKWGGTLPGTSTADNAIISTGTTEPTAATINTALTFNNNVRLAVRNEQYLLVESGGSANFATGIQVGVNAGTGQTAHLTQTGGSLSGTTLTLGTAADAGGEFLMSGTSSLSLTGDATFGTAGVLSLTGSGVSVTIGNGAGDDLFLNGGELVFGAGAAGASTVDVANIFTIDSVNSLLSVDASGLAEGSYDLVRFASVTGMFDANNITLTGLGSGLSGSITYDADSMNLTVIPEPATLGLVGVLGGGLLFFRRLMHI